MTRATDEYKDLRKKLAEVVIPPLQRSNSLDGQGQVGVQGISHPLLQVVRIRRIVVVVAVRHFGLA